MNELKSIKRSVVQWTKLLAFVSLGGVGLLLAATKGDPQMLFEAPNLSMLIFIVGTLFIGPVLMMFLYGNNAKLAKRWGIEDFDGDDLTANKVEQKTSQLNKGESENVIQESTQKQSEG